MTEYVAIVLALVMALMSFGLGLETYKRRSEVADLEFQIETIRADAGRLHAEIRLLDVKFVWLFRGQDL